MQNNEIGCYPERQIAGIIVMPGESFSGIIMTLAHGLGRLLSPRSGAGFVTLALLGSVMFAGWSGAAHAQGNGIGTRANREDLTLRLKAAEGELSDPKLKSSRKKALTTEVATLRTRLKDGDFHVGDLFVITINRDTVSSDTASVREGLVISIGNLPDMSVKGVLRSEITDKVQAYVAKYIKNPTVRVNVTTRLTVLGAVGRPGIYTLSPDKQLTEIVMMAGGPSILAKFDQLEIRRGGKTIISAKQSRKAVLEGKTLEQVGIQSGDEAFVPSKRTFNWQVIVQMLFLASSLFFAFVNFMKFYYSEP